jgi:uncharacterized membrane protein YraQ (UPF0718 family)
MRGEIKKNGPAARFVGWLTEVLMCYETIMKERYKLLIMVGLFALAWFLPVGSDRFQSALVEAFVLARWYAREHVIFCLVPAFFIAGAISVFVSQGAVMKYLGPTARKLVAYSVAATSGTILAVCSCTVLPLFASIHKRGAGLGPATAFLYSGPAINVLAIILTGRVLGLELGIARAVGAIAFSVVIGLLMHLSFRKEEAARAEAGGIVMPDDERERTLLQDGLYFAAMIGLLVFANWGRPQGGDAGLWAMIYGAKWIIAGLFAGALALFVWRWFDSDEREEWVESSWGYAKQIMPLLAGGVLVAGLLLGGPEGGDRGLIPSSWVEAMVGGNSFRANAFASVAGSLMYFATLTEVPILEGLIASGMGKGPALALLLAGPALSLPNMLVIRSVLGWKRTAAFVFFVVVLSTIAGMIYGVLF